MSSSPHTTEIPTDSHALRSTLSLLTHVHPRSRRTDEREDRQVGRLVVDQNVGIDHQEAAWCHGSPDPGCRKRSHGDERETKDLAASPQADLFRLDRAADEPGQPILAEVAVGQVVRLLAAEDLRCAGIDLARAAITEFLKPTTSKL